MKPLLRGVMGLLLLVLPSAEAASAACVGKGGKGTAPTVSTAKFQAWEAVLQATDWGSWAAFMASGGAVPTAPGYRVSGVKSQCRPGELGYVCIMQARLCK